VRVENGVVKPAEIKRRTSIGYLCVVSRTEPYSGLPGVGKYDKPTSFFAQFGNENVTKMLDGNLENLIAEAIR
jgi:hypothetical protein